MNQVILKAPNPNQFTLYWKDSRDTEMPNSRIFLDFNPVIRTAGLSDSYCIVHYQAKPLFLRSFGVLHEGEYHTVDGFESDAPSRGIRLNETNLVSPPNGVIVFPDTQLEIVNNIALITPI